MYFISDKLSNWTKNEMFLVFKIMLSVQLCESEQ